LDMSLYLVEHEQREETERHNVRDVLYAGGGKYKGHYFRVISAPSWRYDSKSYEMVQVDGDEFPPFKTTLGKSWEKVLLTPKDEVWKAELDTKLKDRGLEAERSDWTDGSAQWITSMSEDEAMVLSYCATSALFEAILRHQGKNVSCRSYYSTDPIMAMMSLLEYLAEFSAKQCDKARIEHDEAIARLCREFMAIVELKKEYAKALASFKKHQGEV